MLKVLRSTGWSGAQRKHKEGVVRRVLGRCGGSQECGWPTQTEHANMLSHAACPLLPRRDAAGREVRVQSASALAPASNRPLTEGDVVRALGVALGGAGDNALALASTDLTGLQLGQGAGSGRPGAGSGAHCVPHAAGCSF